MSIYEFRGNTFRPQYNGHIEIYTGRDAVAKFSIYKLGYTSAALFIKKEFVYKREQGLNPTKFSP